MGKKGKVGKNRQDKFYHLAKEQGFRSRASFKLVQLNRRHDFLSSAANGVIDLCAAPGGWMQVARKHMPLGAPCIGIDLVPIRPVQGCLGLVGDITSDATKGELKRALRSSGASEKVDVVLNDGSPNMGKAWLQDAYTQSELTLAALKLASEFLASGGTFVTKVFRSNDYNSLLFVMNQLFNRVNATKPSASRAESAEIYVICLDYKSPKSIDPRLLNPKFVFKDLGSSKDALTEKQDLFLNTVMKDMKKRKRHRGGYEDGQNILFKRVPVLQFCQTPRPVALMVESNQFSFDPRDLENEQISRENALRVAKCLELIPETTSEVLSCCEDLKVLARREFKLLLKWRAIARDVLTKENLLHPTQDAENENENENKNKTSDTEGDLHEENEEYSDGTGDDEVDSEEEKLGEEMQRAVAEQRAKEKRKKRKENKMRSAIQRKIDMKIILPGQGNGYEDNAPVGLFSLRTANQALKHGAQVTNVPHGEDQDAHENDKGYDGDEDVRQSNAIVPYKAGDINAPWQDDSKEIEKDLDRWYKLYLGERKRDKNGVLLKESNERRRAAKRANIREEAQKEERGDHADEAEKQVNLEVDSSASSSSDEDPSDDEFHVPKKALNSREASLWFSQPVFQDIPGLYSFESDSEDEPQIRRDGSKSTKESRSTSGTGESVEEDYQENFAKAARAEAFATLKKEEQRKQEEGDTFEVVPMEGEKQLSSSKRKRGDDDEELSDSSFHSSDYDTDERAEMIAIGKRMRRSKNEANEVLDDAYNRYTFDDPLFLPRWFADADPLYRTRQPPVTKEQVNEMKEYIKSLEAMPTKKEREAKARKRARVAKKMEAMKAKANTIAEQADVPASSRMRAIEELYKKAMKSDKSSKKGKRKQYQVLKPNGRISVGKNISKGKRSGKGVTNVLVDRRMKADKRGLQKAQKRMGKGKKG
ncbi:Ribosomal RNA methyltransferase Spb1 [Gracilaria domingensis]|nr:Ribosomal RNA methyltransferase Spb1 [Gracilaria domingensis]